MYIDDFIWLPGSLEKVEVKHQVSQDEAEEVFFDKPRYRFAESRHQKGEDVYAASGKTEAGRYLIIFLFTNRRTRL